MLNVTTGGKYDKGVTAEGITHPYYHTRAETSGAGIAVRYMCKHYKLDWLPRNPPTPIYIFLNKYININNNNNNNNNNNSNNNNNNNNNKIRRRRKEELTFEGSSAYN